jgi:hypothetical protein
VAAGTNDDWQIADSSFRLCAGARGRGGVPLPVFLVQLAVGHGILVLLLRDIQYSAQPSLQATAQCIYLVTVPPSLLTFLSTSQNSWSICVICWCVLALWCVLACQGAHDLAGDPHLHTAALPWTLRGVARWNTNA